MSVWSNTDASNQKEFTDIEFTYASIGTKNKNFYKVRFSAFVTAFSDNFSQQWSSTAVYGKPDAIETYQGTRRSIDLAWDVPSNGPKEGYNNMIKLETLLKMLYPMYDIQSKKSTSNVATINKPPLLRLKFANLIHNNLNGRGLLGHVNGFSFNPAMDQGMYNTKEPRQRAIGIPDVGLIPKVYSMRCTFTVLHEQDLGFSASRNRFFNNSFPYGFTKGVDDITAANKGTAVSKPETGATVDKSAEAAVTKANNGS
jgi:hypothetical protein